MADINVPPIGMTNAVRQPLVQLVDAVEKINGRLDQLIKDEAENAAAHAVFQASIDSMNKTLGEHTAILGEHSNLLGSIKEMMFKSQNPG